MVKKTKEPGLTRKTPLKKQTAAIKTDSGQKKISSYFQIRPPTQPQLVPSPKSNTTRGDVILVDLTGGIENPEPSYHPEKPQPESKSYLSSIGSDETHVESSIILTPETPSFIQTESPRLYVASIPAAPLRHSTDSPDLFSPLRTTPSHLSESESNNRYKKISISNNSFNFSPDILCELPTQLYPTNEPSCIAETSMERKSNSRFQKRRLKKLPPPHLKLSEPLSPQVAGALREMSGSPSPAYKRPRAEQLGSGDVISSMNKPTNIGAKPSRKLFVDDNLCSDVSDVGLPVPLVVNDNLGAAKYKFASSDVCGGFVFRENIQQQDSPSGNLLEQGETSTSNEVPVMDLPMFDATTPVKSATELLCSGENGSKLLGVDDEFLATQFNLMLSPFDEEKRCIAADASHSNNLSPSWVHSTEPVQCYVVLSREPLADGQMRLCLREKRPFRLVDDCEGSRCDGDQVVCYLSGTWSQTQIDIGQTLNIVGRCDIASDGSLILSNETAAFAVVCPNTLISGTTVVNGIRCPRRAVLSETYKGGSGSKAMLCGSIIHEIFSTAVADRVTDMEKLRKLVRTISKETSNLHQMYALDLKLKQIFDEIECYLEPLIQFVKKHIPGLNKNSKNHLVFPSRDDNPNIVINKVSDIEENFWSPNFGLKGKVDMSVKVPIKDAVSGDISEVLLPLELKSGRESNSVEHRGQTILYCSMFGDRVTAPPLGLLVYLKTGRVYVVPANHMDKRELQVVRNALAYALTSPVYRELDGTYVYNRVCPPPINDQFACQRCDQLDTCALLAKSVESDRVSETTRLLDPMYETAVSHLTVDDFEYFSHWHLLSTLEAEVNKKRGFRSRSWLISAAAAEKLGSCVSDMELVDCRVEGGGFSCKFKSINQKDLTKVSLIVEGDRLGVSSQDGRYIALYTGMVLQILPEFIVLLCEKNLESLPLRGPFRLDKDDFGSSMTSHLTNLSNFMLNSPRNNSLRQLIVGKRIPQFYKNATSRLPNEAKEIVKNVLENLNGPQRMAIKKCLTARDYSLIVGMPGTGKSSLIVAIIRVFIACNLSILVTSYTNSAVDNILLKLIEVNFTRFIRIGRPGSTNPLIHPYLASNLTESAETPEQLRETYELAPVVASTCLGVKHSVFTKRTFDVCIVDEASQISQLLCLGPMLLCDRFILVGDPEQLPPLVQSSEARRLGADESLFQRLAGFHSDAVATLKLQYRMNADIMSLSNHLVYDGQLECGNPTISNRKLNISPQPDSIRELWFAKVLDSQQTIVFLDTQKVDALEEVGCHGQLSNPTEAAVVKTICEQLINSGCGAKDIGIIAPYRHQVTVISQLFLQHRILQDVEIATVDRYQGRDKDVIIISFVRSSLDSEQIGELLKDTRRLNVALTRAKCKLIMVGNTLNLCNAPPVAKLITFIRERGWITDITHL